MPIGLIGRKCGMTRIFTEEGVSIPVTVVEVEPNRIVRVKSQGTDGYCAIQVTTGSRRANRITRAEAGHFAKAGVELGRGLWEFPLRDGENETLAVGQEIALDIFQPGQRIDAKGISIGKGYAGVVKRHNFRTQDASHGNSLSHRAPGSIGQNQTPGRVFKGKRMAGHMGNAWRTVQNLEVIRVDKARKLILVKGAVPGPKGGDLIINATCKMSRKESE
jgi:large subunit ribosomal protein L3